MLKNHQMYLFELTPLSNTPSSYNFKKILEVEQPSIYTITE